MLPLFSLNLMAFVFKQVWFQAAKEQLKIRIPEIANIIHDNILL